jgi:hypothetical protein
MFVLFCLGRSPMEADTPPRSTGPLFTFHPTMTMPRQRRQRRRAPLPCATPNVTRLVSSVGVVALLRSSPLFLATWIGRRGRGPSVSAHGYLKTPRSRNLVACESIASFRPATSMARNLRSHLRPVRVTGPIVVVLSIARSRFDPSSG